MRSDMLGARKRKGQRAHDETGSASPGRNQAFRASGRDWCTSLLAGLVRQGRPCGRSPDRAAAFIAQEGVEMGGVWVGRTLAGKLREAAGAIRLDAGEI